MIAVGCPANAFLQKLEGAVHPFSGGCTASDDYLFPMA